MKNIWKVTALLFLTCFLLFEQSIISQTNPDKFLKKASVDFAVPDAPAFKILQTNFSTVIVPTSVREVAVTVADILKNGEIPGNYALEISPGLIFSNSLAAYQRNPFFYRARISFATKTLKNNSRQTGVGIRLTLWDETDLRTDKSLEEALINIGHISDSLKLACVSDLEKQKIDPFDSDYETLLNECLDKKGFKKISGKIETQREIAKKNHWNAPIIEVGLASSALSIDSVENSFMVNKYMFWLSGAYPLGIDGQLLIGLNGGLEKNRAGELRRTQGELGVRGYYGDNQRKIFLEWNIKSASEISPSIAGNIGYEMNLMNGLWADISLGIINKEGSKFITNSSVNLRFATPE